MVVALLLASDFPSENPRIQKRTILIRNRWQQGLPLKRLKRNK